MINKKFNHDSNNVRYTSALSKTMWKILMAGTYIQTHLKIYLYIGYRGSSKNKGGVCYICQSVRCICFL